ncbi:MAG: hypothetical protein V4726_09535 [Verrucomicrobiota bacterium]
MRLQKLSDGTIRLSQLNPWEVRTFRSLPALADFSGHEAAERRLLPSPAVEADLTPEMGMDWVEYVIPELRDSFAHNLGTVMADLENLKTHQPGGDGPGKDTGKKADAAGNGGADSQNGSQRPGNGEDDRLADQPHDDPGADDCLDEDGDDDDDDDDFDESENAGESTAGSAAGPPMELYTVDIPSAHAEQWFRAMNQARLVLSARHGIDSEHLPDLASLLASGRLEHWFQYELFVSLQGWLVDAVLDAG